MDAKNGIVPEQNPEIKQNKAGTRIKMQKQTGELLETGPGVERTKSADTKIWQGKCGRAEFL